MGKNRKSGSGTSKDDSSFITRAGFKVPLNGYSVDVLESLQENIKSWIEWGGPSIAKRFYDYNQSTPAYSKILNYVVDSMESTSNHLYRVEPVDANFLKENLKVGKWFNFKDKEGSVSRLSAFSKDIASSEKIMDDWFKNGEEIVLFRTNGSVNYFDTSKWYSNSKYDYENEVWVGSVYGKDWKVTGIESQQIGEHNVLVVDIQ